MLYTPIIITVIIVVIVIVGVVVVKVSNWRISRNGYNLYVIIIGYIHMVLAGWFMLRRM